MKDKDKTKEQLLEEFVELRRRVAEFSKSEERLNQAERQAGEFEGKYKNIVELTTDSIVTLNLKGRVTSCNPSFMNLTGYSEDELVGKHFTKLPFLSAGDIPKYIKIFNFILRGKIPGPFEGKWTHKNGDNHWGEVHVSLIKDGRKTIGVQAVSRDITERKKTEEAIRNSEERYRILVNTSPDAITMTDLEGKITFASPQTLKMYGYGSHEEMIGKNAVDFIAPEEHKKALANLKKALKAGFIKDVEYKMLRKDGTPFTGELSSSLIRNAEGKPSAFIATVRDITERKESDKALRESEEKYRAIFESFYDVYYRTDKEGIVTLISPSVKAQAGYDPDDVIGHYVTDFYLNPAEREEFTEALKKTGIINDYEITLRAKDGRPIDVSVSSKIIFDKDGNSVGVEGVLRDITTRKKAEFALRESEEKYRAMVENSLQGIVIVQDSRLVYSNSAVSEIIGYSIEELSSLSPEQLRDLVHPEDQELVWERMKDRLDGKDVTSRYELRAIKKDGSVAWLQVVSSRIEYLGKSAIQAVILDFTERRQAEEVLRESEEKFRSLAEKSPNMIFINKMGRVIYANQKCEEIMGYTRDEIYSPDFDFLTMIAPESKVKIKANYQKHMKGEEVSPYEYGLMTKEGKEIDALLTTKLISYDGDKAILGIVADITEQKRREKEIQQSYRRLRETFDETVNALASAVEMRDPYTAGHQHRVAKLAYAIAKEMKLPEDTVEGIRVTGLIHDIGKIYVPAEILSKPTPLTEAEKSLVRNHSQVGYDILKRISFPWPVADIVLQHHERMLGSGYPLGLSGEDILLEARILGVADVVETMYAHRPYRPAFGIEKALHEISRNRAILYDPKVVDVCLELFMKKGFKFDEDMKSDIQSSEFSEQD